MSRRWVYHDGVGYEVGVDIMPDEKAELHYVMGDIQPYQSMIDGKMVTSRSQHKAHLRANGCVEVGNETKHLLAKAQPIQPPPGRKEMLIQLANERLRWKPR